MTDKKSTIHPLGAAAIGAMVGAGVAAGAAVAIKHPKVKKALEQLRVRANQAMQDTTARVHKQIEPIKEQIMQGVNGGNEIEETKSAKSTTHKKKAE